MRFKNNGPITLYVVMDVQYGNVVKTRTNKVQAIRDAKTFEVVTKRTHKVLTYDQR